MRVRAGAARVAAAGVLLVGGLLVAGCKPKPQDEPTSGIATSAAPVADSTCADDGARLPGTGLCAGRAVNYLNTDAAPSPQLPDGCAWVVNEAEFPGGYLLYRAAQCRGVTATLEYAGGAHSAELKLIRSGLNASDIDGPVLVRIFSAEGAPEQAIQNHAREAIENAVEARHCSPRKAGIDGWPTDAMVVDIPASEAAKAPKDEPRTACGPLGLDEDSASYWRVFQGFAWHYELGQDIPEIDPASLTVMEADGNGGWQAVQ